jgi:transposase
MKQRQKLLTDKRWQLIEPLLPPPRRRKDNRGRPWTSNRACFERILWIFQTCAASRFLPDEHPSPSTCWRRLKQWEEEDVWLGRMACSVRRARQEGSHPYGQPPLPIAHAPKPTVVISSPLETERTPFNLHVSSEMDISLTSSNSFRAALSKPGWLRGKQSFHEPVNANAVLDCKRS